MEFVLQVKVLLCSCTVISTLLPLWQKAARVAKSLISLSWPRLRTTGSANKKSWQDGARKSMSRSSHSLWLSFISSPLGCPPPFSPSLLFPLTGNYKPKAFGADWERLTKLFCLVLVKGGPKYSDVSQTLTGTWITWDFVAMQTLVQEFWNATWDAVF